MCTSASTDMMCTVHKVTIGNTKSYSHRSECYCRDIDSDEDIFDELPANQQGLPDYDDWEVPSSQPPVKIEDEVKYDDGEVAFGNTVIDLTKDISNDDTIIINSDHDSDCEIIEPPAKKQKADDTWGCDFCFTLNNPTARKITEIKKWAEKMCKFFVMQGERGEQKTPHLQGFFQLKKRVRFSTIKNQWAAMDCKPHLAKRRGTVQEAVEYCEKEDTYDSSVCERWRCGEMEKKDQKGKRSDLIDIFARIKAGDKKQAIAESHPGSYLRYRRNIVDTINDLKEDKKRDRHRLIVLFGSSGSGKSYTARKIAEKEIADFGGTFASIKRDLSDYMQFGSPDVVVVEEFKGSIELADYKSLFDGEATQPKLGQRFSNSCYSARLTIITSNYHPATWYAVTGKKDPNVKAVYRRIDECYEFTGEYGNPDDPVEITPLDCKQPGVPDWWLENIKIKKADS